VDRTVVEQRILEQSVRLPEGGAVTGWAALRMAGAAYFDGVDPAGALLPVPLAVGRARNIAHDAAIIVSREPLAADEIRTFQGVPCANPKRALFDELRRLDAREGAVAMSMTAAARLVAIWEMKEYCEERKSWRRASGVPPALELADEASRSPAEPRLRHIWELDAGLPRPLSNRATFDLAGNLLGIPDLLDVQAGVVGEYDGATHLRMKRRSKDLTREEKFRRAGLEYFAVVGSEMHDRDLVVARMRSVRERALANPRPRRWTIEPPDTWAPVHTYGEELRMKEWLHQL
jgi:hypothetical protein